MPTDVTVEMQSNSQSSIMYIVRWNSPVATHGEITNYRIEYYPSMMPDTMLYLEFGSTVSFCQLDDLCKCEIIMLKISLQFRV